MRAELMLSFVHKLNKRGNKHKVEFLRQDDSDEVANCYLTLKLPHFEISSQALKFRMRSSLVFAVVATISLLATEAASMTPTSNQATATHSALRGHRVLLKHLQYPTGPCEGCNPHPGHRL
ncbi:hypothetical protein PsorP6_011798 [Peronosclerospora sorghi]|uniref:Uncharacterized protein n=1 Tax=Peronosclerospora sorghi TaxID=230839 RepID=A0ACC0WKS3_9STRA|nr:hypothetical protein PsorP6_011798 [Peronosclerospora sorghi]